MERYKLDDFEQRCIQDELPYCQAACPLKVDAKAFCAAMAQKRFDEARKILSKTMPLPDIIGRICDHPCQDACILSQKGGAILIGKLERACLQQTKDTGLPLRLPPKGLSVTVYGGGLSSLTCAFELAKKGYQVCMVFNDETPGGRLLTLTQEVLPQEVLVTAWQNLQRLGVTRSSGKDPIRDCLKEGNVAYVGIDDPEWTHLINGNDIDPITYETFTKGLFAGGYLRNNKPSPSWESADGKRAANSIDRYFQGASLTSGREKEFSLDTKLYTSIEGVPTLSPKDDPIEEAKRCIQCECRCCVRECVFLEKYKGYPKIYVRQIYNNFAIVRGSHSANKMINSCSLCGLCEVLCPNDFSMAELCRFAREEMVERNIMPPSVHEFALLDMEHANSPRSSGFRSGAKTTEAIFFPGCQLSGAMPDQTERVANFLGKMFDGKMGIMLGCCGAPAWWAGRQDKLNEVIKNIEKTVESAGNPTLILACSSCNEVFKNFMPNLSRVSLWQVLLEKGLPETRPATETLALHDPCTTRHEPEWRQSVRKILQILGQPYEELVFGGEATRCCGYGGLQSMADPDLAREGVSRRLQESKNDFLTYCAMCRESLSGSEKTVLHLLDILFPPPAEKKRAGFSKRQQNRELLRVKLLGPCDLAPNPWDDLLISIPDAVREKLEDRHILDSDIRQTLWEASSTGRYLISPDGTRLASSRIGNVTFWVEYREDDHSFTIVNAWSHRMIMELMS
ncbi:aldehyde dehydrogenase, iron-sulfur subunit [Acetomicrobium mobile DSM 13181]|uniref:Aldehyde dehydrogenase, iron-sulfur subunit n=1 Tax=Acetomicrobium mobile (strain ATCC BAA-54 / DSM 13181 / JCM 12221 / NGA) TaxID=891968 RepID=I4BWM4_ACEMN|nr:pyridine nucleotide-disulfide oxidoreductase/dicluster-binding protein [Acetomicrobium mobile]AFM21681.1 aldehyde dehydrogenase, iron-sulfur subunit [Acetomicrobium mobile DSM 13181]